MEEKIIKLGKLIKKAEKILLINHINMDPDAFGSLGAFHFIMQKIGKTVKSTNDFSPGERMHFLNKKNIIETNLNLKKYNPDLIISFDAASISQLGKTYEEHKDLFEKKDFVVIDHHKTNPGFGNLNIINSDFSSTCEIVYLILEKLDFKKYITEKEATLLTAGIHTDTNLFYNQNTSSNTLFTAGKLMDLGADYRISIYNFFNKVSLNQLKLYAKIFEKLKSEKNGKIIYAYIEKKDFLDTNTSLDDSSGIINKLSNIVGTEIIFLIYELENNMKKVSFRSKNFDVAKLCQNFENGGGHKNAAGFTSSIEKNKLIKNILDKLVIG